jgi:hypothetical protein
MQDVYHEMEFPVEMLSGIKAIMMPSGILALVEFKPNCPNDCIGVLHRMSIEQVEKEMKVNGFKLDKIIPFSFQNLFIFSKIERILIISFNKWERN